VEQRPRGGYGRFIGDLVTTSNGTSAPQRSYTQQTYHSKDNNMTITHRVGSPFNFILWPSAPYGCRASHRKTTAKLIVTLEQDRCAGTYIHALDFLCSRSHRLPFRKGHSLTRPDPLSRPSTSLTYAPLHDAADIISAFRLSRLFAFDSCDTPGLDVIGVQDRSCTLSPTSDGGKCVYKTFVILDSLSSWSVSRVLDNRTRNISQVSVGSRRVYWLAFDFPYDWIATRLLSFLTSFQ
jgi:hypothetical protein